MNIKILIKIKNTAKPSGRNSKKVHAFRHKLRLSKVLSDKRFLHKGGNSFWCGRLKWLDLVEIRRLQDISQVKVCKSAK